VRLAAPRGVDVVLEAVGGAMLHESIGLLAPFGRAVVYGASAGDLPRSVTNLGAITSVAREPKDARQA
jgi:NADPH:quinone reductase-like Zn-dependent oxidoreductase